MKITEYPIEHLADLEQKLIDKAAHEQTMGDQADALGRPVAGPYRAALAYYESARAVSNTTNRVIAHLDRLAADEQDPPHQWPIPLLENLTMVHRGDDIPAHDSETWAKRFPRWGVETDDRGDATRSNAITAVRSAFGDGVILDVTSGDGGTQAPQQQITLNLDFERWDALVLFVERLRAGKPVPYNNQGDTLTQEATQ